MFSMFLAHLTDMNLIFYCRFVYFKSFVLNKLKRHTITFVTCFCYGQVNVSRAASANYTK